jgi:hypothetical protein
MRDTFLDPRNTCLGGQHQDGKCARFKRFIDFFLLAGNSAPSTAIGQLVAGMSFISSARIPNFG